MISLATESQTQRLRKGGCGGLRLHTLVAEGAEESWQAVAVPGHVVTGTTAVHALRAWLAAVVSIEARGAN